MKTKPSPYLGYIQQLNEMVKKQDIRLTKIERIQGNLMVNIQRLDKIERILKEVTMYINAQQPGFVIDTYHK